MSAMFPLIFCAKCGSRMQVRFVQAANDGNDVTYECAPCGTMETVTIPAPGEFSLKSAVSRKARNDSGPTGLNA
jgi:uncharacterized Zn finger protein